MLTVLSEVIEHCPLCFNYGNLFYKEQFFLCNHCHAIFRAKKQLPNLIDEKKRYEEHNNCVNDLKYQQFVSPITKRVINDFSTDSIGLDFGSGTGAVISKVLQDHGFLIKQYDPFFNNIPELLHEKYDYIVCCEVIEHFHYPAKEFDLLKKMLKPNGCLYLMTNIYSMEIDFDKWYYKNDKTHVFFYQNQTLELIKSKYDFKSLTIDNRLIVFNN